MLFCGVAQKSSSEEETMETTQVEKFFALWKDNSQEKMETQIVNTTKHNRHVPENIQNNCMIFGPYYLLA